MERMAVAGWCGLLSRDSSNLSRLHFSLHFPSFSNDDDLRHMVMIIPKQNCLEGNQHEHFETQRLQRGLKSLFLLSIPLFHLT